LPILKWGYFMNRETSVVRIFGSAACAALFIMHTTSYGAEYNGPKITFEDIYANPDNQDLNLNYARQQVAAGDLLSAAATLERMLYASPNWDSARLFYALILFRLDDRQAAIRELNLLDGRPLSPKQRALAQSYRDNIENGGSDKAASGFSGRLAIGVRYDNNAGNALADTLLTFADRSDQSLFVQAALKYSNPIGDNGLKFNAGIEAQTRRHEAFSRANYDSFGGTAGLSGNMGDAFVWAADSQIAQINISGQRYLRQYGGRLTLKRAIGETTALWIRGTWYDQDYDDLAFTNIETLRSGDKLTASAGLIKNFSGKSFLNASIGYENKNASDAIFAYDGIRVSGNFKNAFNNGVYINGRATYRMLKYDGPSFNNPNPTRREDNHLYGRLGLGASINAIGTMMKMTDNPGLDNIYLETGMIYTNRNSNNSVLDYENIGAELKLILDF